MPLGIGVFTAGATNRCIGVLGGGQVDRFGNINSTWMNEDLYLTGSGGANDVASGAKEVVVVMQQSARRFLEKVPYITAPGHAVRTLVSTMGVFQKLQGEEAPGYPPSRFLRRVLDWVHRGRGRIIYE